MARHHDHGKLSKKMKSTLPEIYQDTDSDFASIKISKGVEAKSYLKDGFVFCEDAKGNIIEVQILNLSKLAKGKRSKRPA
jgi:hypothetical protein